MELNILLSGAIGALVAAIVAIFYQHVNLLQQRGYEIAVDTAKYYDNLYDLIEKLIRHRDFKYIRNSEVLSEREYAELLDNISESFSSHLIYVKIILVE